MEIQKIISLTLLAVYAILVILAIILFLFAFIEKRKARKSLRDSVLKKITNSIQFDAGDVITMAKGVGLQRPSVNLSVYRLLHDADDDKTFQQLKILSLQLEKEEPFDDLPDEVKPALIRLTELCNESQQKSDHFLLASVQRALGSYVELQAEMEKSRKWAKWVNVIGVASFIIGTWGFYLSWKSPDIKDIEVAVAKALAR
jgi:hypothetical protein